MKRLLATAIASASIAIGAIPALAEVDPKIHKLCLEAKDYLGCVKAMRGDTMPTSRVINSQGADMAEENQCPSMFAYKGGGNCQEVKCGKSIYGNDERLGGKFWYCKSHLLWRNSLYLGEKIVRASYSKECPDGEPGIGYNSTCESIGAQQDPRNFYDLSELGDKDRVHDLVDENDSINSSTELDSNYLRHFNFMEKRLQE